CDFFFFSSRRRHTRWPRDWSSDVCSSDLTAASKSATGQYFQRIHALDLASGAERPGSPIAVQATYPGSGANSTSGIVSFDPAFRSEERRVGKECSSWCVTAG